MSISFITGASVRFNALLARPLNCGLVSPPVVHFAGAVLVVSILDRALLLRLPDGIAAVALEPGAEGGGASFHRAGSGVGFSNSWTRRCLDSSEGIRGYRGSRCVRLCDSFDSDDVCLLLLSSCLVFRRERTTDAEIDQRSDGCLWDRFRRRPALGDPSAAMGSPSTFGIRGSSRGGSGTIDAGDA